MPTITIPASEVRQGDAISLGGNLRTVVDITGRGDMIIVYVDAPFSAISFPPDQTLTVDRPEPDAELIEAIAAGIFPWVSRVNQMEVSRAALAACRAYCNRTQA